MSDPTPPSGRWDETFPSTPRLDVECLDEFEETLMRQENADQHRHLIEAVAAVEGFEPPPAFDEQGRFLFGTGSVAGDALADALGSYGNQLGELYGATDSTGWSYRAVEEIAAICAEYLRRHRRWRRPGPGR